MKILGSSAILLLFCFGLRAQTKIFREVGEDISTQMRAITQDNALVGCLAFTRLEKASEDSFNYRITIMDENLNDIGTVNFRQANLVLQTVSFEANVLCIGYIQTSLTGMQKIRSHNGLQKAEDAASYSHILLQFINLDGKVINTYYKDAHMEVRLAQVSHRAPVVIGAELKYGMQIKNIPKHGFAFFYGDDMMQKLLVFDDKGELRHEIESPMLAERYYLLASGEDIYLMLKQNERVPEGAFTLFDYSARDLRPKSNFDLRDGYDNWLKVLSSDIDPASGDAYIAGCIINPKRENQFLTIPHKDGNVKINVFPAKEGHMMVAEYNKKEKFTRFSIEAL